MFIKLTVKWKGRGCWDGVYPRSLGSIIAFVFFSPSPSLGGIKDKKGFEKSLQIGAGNDAYGDVGDFPAGFKMLCSV